VTRFIFALRTMPPTATRAAAQAIDAATERLVAALAGFDLAAPPPHFNGHEFRHRVHLPIRNGGAGVPGLATIAPAAYTAAVVQAMPHLRRHAPDVVNAAVAPPPAPVLPPQPQPPLPAYVTATRDAIASMRAEGADVQQQMDGFNPFNEAPPSVVVAAGSPADRPLRLQQRLAKILHDNREKKMLAQLNAGQPPLGQMHGAAFLSGGRGGGAWLTASPAFPPNRMEDACFSIALRFHLGVPFVSIDENGQCPHPNCGRSEDPHGHHAFRCDGLKGNANTRHKWANDAVYRISTEAGFTAAREVPYEAHFSRNPSAPASSQSTVHRIDTLVTTATGTKVVIDTTVRHPIHGSSHETRGAAAAAAEKDKVDWISTRYTISKENIIPFAIETFGVMGAVAQKFLRTAARNKAGDDKIAYAQLISFYRARIAVAVQRGNALAINNWLNRRAAVLGSVVGSSA
jgi:hypothetical protein